MGLFTRSENQFVVTLGNLIDCNPFLPERLQHERDALGEHFVERDANWNLDPTNYRRSANVIRIGEKAEALLLAKQEQLAAAASWSELEMQRYADLVDYVMFSQLVEPFSPLLDAREWKQPGRIYQAFCKKLERFQPEALSTLGNRTPAHLFSIYFQLYRAFRNIFDHLIGNSDPIIQLRAEVWRSIFTHDVRRYREQLYSRMRDFSTLITGPSGSGKELVAQAIALSAYVPYSESENGFAADANELFSPINLSALSPTLIESELFGHSKGAYTGATSDRKGWLEACQEFGSVFLDEVGELDLSIQVKLLRVLQERTFQRLGDTQAFQFDGKIIAATNRDVSVEIEAKRFRTDFYYRICSDQITMPSLAERCQNNRDELAHLVAHLLGRVICGNLQEVTDELLAWIKSNLREDYAWPGNVRELDQCIRSWLIRKTYQPVACVSLDERGKLEMELRKSTMTADELISLYCATKHKQLGSYQAVGKLVNLDRRTVRARVDDAANE